MELFERAVVLDPGARIALLDESCRDDATLRRNVEQLLRADAKAQSYLVEPLGVQADRSGEKLGAYRLNALLGRGGMGSVYRAERIDGAFDKPVAIKLLTFDAGDLRARFAQEQRILGNLSHAHIATLLDVGSDANGAPYFVMDYIDGVAITHYAREHRLDLRAKIELFLPLLGAVQSAHSQLIVHRDIKPGNVLVDRNGVAKLLDFGIAKLLVGSGVVAATRTGLGPLTPEYASPEQVRGEPIGTPSDIYSLGILLYELLTGERPYTIGDTSPSGIERTICDAEPERPSSRLRLSAGAGSSRDLDAILLKALAKAPARRYASCTEFAADLERWLKRETVVAREPSARERLARYVRRHRLGVSVAAAASIALLVGLAVAVWEAQLAREQARIAGVERDRSRRVNKFLTDTLSAANPAELGRKATVLDVLARARQFADKELGGDAATTATTQQVLSDTYRALADFGAARDTAQSALKAARASGDPEVLIGATHALAAADYSLGDLKGAAELANEGRAVAVTHGTATQRADMAVLLGQIAAENGDTAKAAEWYDRALAESPRTEVEERATILNNYGALKHEQGDDAASLAKYREAIALMSSLYPDGHAAMISLYGNLAAALRTNGQLDEAVGVLTDKVLPRQIELFGESSADVLWTLSNLATFEYERKNPTAMLAYAERGFHIAEHLPDSDNWKALAFKKYGVSLIRADRPQEALPVLVRALALCKATLPPDHHDIASLESSIGLARSLTGDRATGEPLARGAYERLLAKYGAKYEVTVTAKKNLDKIEAMPQPVH